MSSGARPATLGESWMRRRPERILLLWSLACVALGFLMIWGSNQAGGKPVATADLAPFLAYAGSIAVLHFLLVSVRFNGDQLLVAAVAFLAGIGLLAQIRMGSSGSALPGFLLFPVGIFVMLSLALAARQGRYHWLSYGMWAWGGVSLAILGALLLTGQRFRGGVYAAGFITPSEILKLTIVLFLARFLDARGKTLGKWTQPLPFPPWRDVLPLLLFWTLLAVLLLLQRDLGMFVILSATMLAMLVVASGRIGYLVYALLVASALSYAVLDLLSHGQRRIDAWLDPFRDPTGDGWQILQGLAGMYSGGLWGEGFGQGNPEYTPIAESDFIYAVIGEELGFAGCCIVILFFLLLIHRGLYIANQTRSSYGTLLCTGLSTVIATQAFLNVAGVTKLVPLTGLTLPLISHGGSSMLTAFASLGLILAISDGESATARKIAPSSGVSKGGSPRRKKSGPKASPMKRNPSSGEAK